MKTYEIPRGGSSGTKLDAIGLGTWKMEDGSATDAVRAALEMGYRHIDCAPIYMNEADIGVAFADVFSGGQVRREDVWITSKLWCNRHRPDLVRGALEDTLKDLQLDYLDLFMIHWPIVFRHDIHRPESGADFFSLEQMPIAETWSALEECQQAGLCRNLGVCNFSIKKLKPLLETSSIKPVVNQVECHPFLPQQQLMDFCHQNNMQFVAYSPLGSGDRPDRMKDDSDPNLFEQSAIAEIAAARGVSAGQIMLTWQVNRGAIAIPKSSNPGRMKDNLAAGSLELTAEEMSAIDSITVHHRYVHGQFWVHPSGPNTIENLWDEGA